MSVSLPFPLSHHTFSKPVWRSYILSLSVCLSVCLPLSLSLSLSPLSPYPISVCLSTLSHYPLSMSVCLSVSFSLCLSHSLSLYSLYLCLSVSQSVCFYIIYRYIFLYIIYYFKISAQPAPSIHLSDDEYMDRRLSMGRWEGEGYKWAPAFVW